MKKTFLFLLLFLTVGFYALTQDTIVPSKIRFDKAGTVSVARPLVLVDGFETDMQSLVLNPDRIERIDILKGNDAVAKYGGKANDGVILITAKSETEFYTIADFVNAEKNINRSVKQIELNGKLLPDMQKLLIDKKALTSTLISSDVKMDEKTCEFLSTDTLLINTKDSGTK